MNVEHNNFIRIKNEVKLKGEHKILKDGIVGMTKTMHENRKYFNYDREELELLVAMYHDALEHINEFCMELKEGNNVK